MDKVARYRAIVKQVLTRYAEQYPSHGQIETAPLFDDVTDHYMVVDYGWDRTGRVHAPILHVHLREGKVWVELDNTEDGIAPILLAASVPQQDIVLAFYRPERRRLTEFAVA